MRSHFDEQLAKLDGELITMGALCEEAIEACAVYLEGNTEGIHERIDLLEREIDSKESEIESVCLKLLLRQQPVAKDLRMISSALKMISDMERIGDQASDIAEMVSTISRSGLRSETHIIDMARATIKMVNSSIDSFVKKDAALAERVLTMDDEVDRLFDQVKEELIESVESGHSNAEALIDLLMIAKYFERIGDHAENIAEWVLFSITGKK